MFLLNSFNTKFKSLQHKIKNKTNNKLIYSSRKQINNESKLVINWNPKCKIECKCV